MNNLKRFRRQQYYAPYISKLSSFTRLVLPYVGIACATFLVCILAFILWMYFSAYIHETYVHKQTTCQSNLKQMGTAMQMYAQDYGGKFPPADEWNDLIYPYTKNPKLLICPLARDKSKPSYAMNSRLSGFAGNKVKDPLSTIMLFESKPGVNQSGDPEILVSPPRHKIGNNFGFSDGHVKWCGQSDFGSLQWDPNKK